ncbi:MAG: RdgB/HAM1 family non-canonical purine NTP pyrophosphatase [Flavobacteriaceae bacterium]|nr:RdgB/HAM1 family non-canonical purine NTP pyrophosphatase [Flavobacteriaceae bacterium]MCY4254292.1 RdgB/HAM1 family non-canonical purine NTP pyrophosphatase [Flavobacteriaceae bacterium]
MDKPTIVLASHNVNKLIELKQSLDKSVRFLSLNDIGFHQDIPETATTLEANALLKAKTVSRFCQLPTLSDDTGLFVKALNGLPGVRSARYAGERATTNQNIEKLLTAMEQNRDRSAIFRTVFCLFHHHEPHFIKGEVEGLITTKKQGEKGFGYDPIFIPQGHQHTFGQMSLDQKNLYSHRAKAINALSDFLLYNEFPRAIGVQLL